jgi:hypothetical protein
MGLWLLSFGCAQDADPLSENSVLKGSVSLSDQYDDVSGVKITAAGPYGSKSALSVRDGSYLVSGLPNGTYEVSYTKEGYGSVTYHGVQFFGSDTVFGDYALLYSLPDKPGKMPKFTACNWREDGLWISTDYTATNSYWPVRLFFSVNEKVSCDNYDFTYTTTANYNNEIWVGQYYLSFASGVKIYVMGYPCNTLDNGYTNTYTGLRVFSSLIKEKPSNTVSFIMP